MLHDLLSHVRSGAALAGVVGLTLGAGQLVPLTTPAAASPSTVASVHWRPCGDGFDCATVRVPLDHDHPHGPDVSLAVTRLPAARPSARIGSLLVNPGGPGGSGVDFVRGTAPSFPQQLRNRFDIVGFDPRGVIGSTPLRCFRTIDQAFATLPPFAFPVTTREENVERASDRRLATACARRGGPILGHMSTADVARDMDVLRGALGDRRISYVGFSYGSFLGETYANLFPRRVRALVIDGVIDPVAWTTGRRVDRSLPFSTRLRSDVGARATLGEFFRLCDAAGGRCAFSGHARQRYAALAAQLRRHPVVVHDPSGDIRLGYADLVGVTLGSLYSPPTWPDLADFLASLEQEAGTSAVRALAAVRAGLGLRTAREDYPNYVEGFPGVICSDSENPHAFAAWRRAADRSERRHGYFGRSWTWASSVCLPWPERAGQDRYVGPWSARTSSPVLVVGNYFDPATRYHGAVTASRLLPRSRLLSYAGWGHTAFLTGIPCIDDHVTAYLVHRRLPVAGTVCRPLGSPFAASGARGKAAVRAGAAASSSLLPESARRVLTAPR